MSVFGNLFTIHDKIATDVCKGVRHTLRCNRCLKTQNVDAEDFSRYLAHGWPKCCGNTMTLESEPIKRRGK